MGKKICIILFPVFIVGILSSIYFFIMPNFVKPTSVGNQITEEQLAEADKNHDGEITGDELEKIKSPEKKETTDIDKENTKEESIDTDKELQDIQENGTIPTRKKSKKKTTPEMQCWLRAHISYQHEKGITRLDDSRINFANLKWKKADDGWYYYEDPVPSGVTVAFINGVMIPFQWTNNVANKDFSIKITVEAAEVMKGDVGWNNNSEVAYEKVYDFINLDPNNKEAQPISNGRMLVKINEWERDETGRIFPYQNDKVIVPNEYVSKIVEFTVQRVLIRSTGDIARLELYAGGFGLCLAGIYTLIEKKKKRKVA